MKNEVDSVWVRMTQIGPHCPIHGIIKGAEYRQQMPAPCGCDWVWEEGQGYLVAQPNIDFLKNYFEESAK